MSLTNEIDTHDPAGMASFLRERAKANREIAELPREQWPYRPAVLQHWALRFEQAAEMIEELVSECEHLRSQVPNMPPEPRSIPCSQCGNVVNHCDRCKAELLSSSVEPKAPHPDTERLDWVLRNVSGAEWYRLGIIYDSGMTRDDLDKWLALNR